MRIDEVPGFGDAVVALDLGRVVAAHLADLRGRPQVELAFDALGVGVLRGVEAAGGIAQVAEHVADDVVDDCAISRLVGREERVEVRPRE